MCLPGSWVLWMLLCCSRPMQRQTSNSNPTKQLLQWAQHKTRFYDVSNLNCVYTTPQCTSSFAWWSKLNIAYTLTSLVLNLQDVNVTDFTHSFKDGLALAAIMHCYVPECVPIEELSVHTPRRNFEVAFAAAKWVMYCCVPTATLMYVHLYLYFCSPTNWSDYTV